MDHRERRSGLVDLLTEMWPSVTLAALDVGDVRVGPRVLVERKTVHDLVVSIRDGRLYRQLYALCGACPRPLLLIEGPTSLPAAGMSAASLRGVLLSVAVGYRVPMLRTTSVRESCIYLARLAEREQRRLVRSPQPPAERTGPLAVLAAVPGVGEERAAALLQHFGTVGRALDAPLEQLIAVPGIGPETARCIRRASTGGRDP